MKMKKGTNVGKIDANLEAIKVGDMVKNTISCKNYRVDAYGSLRFGEEVIAPKDWNGDRYVILPDCPEAEPDLIPEQETESVDIFPEAIPAETPDKKTERLAAFTDLDLAEELRARGYEVKAVRTITVEL